jgi:hypothetical protein
MKLEETKKDREWKFGKGIKGTVRAALTKHPDKFSKEACKDKGEKDGKLCPYAIFAAKKGKFEPHYKDQPSTLKGKPEKKDKFKDEESKSFKEWLDNNFNIITPLL